MPGNGHKVADSPAGQQAPPHVHLKPSSEQALPTASDVASPVSMQEPSLAPQAAESYSAPPSLSQQPKETLASQASSSPVNTADAVAEAIKAAAAVTGGSGMTYCAANIWPLRRFIQSLSARNRQNQLSRVVTFFGVGALPMACSPQTCENL